MGTADSIGDAQQWMDHFAEHRYDYLLRNSDFPGELDLHGIIALVDGKLEESHRAEVQKQILSSRVAAYAFLQFYDDRKAQKGRAA